MIRALADAFGGLPPTRFAACATWRAALTLCVLLGLIAYGLGLRGLPSETRAARSQQANPLASSPADDTDLKLYKTIAARVAAGESYYAAATAEQRREGYPLRPFVTVRLPTLALLQARLGLAPLAALVYLAVLSAWAAMAWRLRATVGPGRVALYGSSLAAIGLGVTLAPSCLYWHEPLAAVLLVLSLACRGRDRWIASVLFAVAAATVRELALPFLLAMGAAAVLDGRRREAMAWAFAVVVVAFVLVAHATMLSAYVRPDDLHSPGWTGVGGWPFILKMARNFSSFSILPAPLVAIVLPLALLGWAACPGSFAARGAFVLYGYVAAFMIFGRADNDYWGMLIAPLIPIGLVFVPAALRDLAGAMSVSPRDRQAETGCYSLGTDSVSLRDT